LDIFGSAAAIALILVFFIIALGYIGFDRVINALRAFWEIVRTIWVLMFGEKRD